jgi:hypothetical protein
MPTAEPRVPQPPGVEVVYVDGTVWLLEAADALRYHVVERSHPKKTSHPAFTQVCLCLLVWSGAFESSDPWFTMDDEDRDLALRCSPQPLEYSALLGSEKLAR